MRVSYQIHDLQIFSHICRSSLHFLGCFLWSRTEFWILVESNLSIFTFDVTFKKKKQKKMLPNSRSWRFTLVFSSERFIVLVFTFRSLIHFELIFVYGMRRKPNFILLQVDIQLSQNYFLQKITNLSPISLSLRGYCTSKNAPGTVWCPLPIAYYLCLTLPYPHSLNSV